MINPSHASGDTGHIADHNTIATFVNNHDDVDAATTAHHHTLGTAANQAAAGNHTHAGSASLETTTAPPSTNTTGSVLGTATTASHSDHTHRVGDHDHSATGSGAQIGLNALSATGTRSNKSYLRGDNTFATITKTIRIPHTFSFYGSSLTTTGNTPQFRVPVPTGQTATVAEVSYASESGTATFDLQFWSGTAWTGVTGATSLAVSSTAGIASPAVSLTGNLGTSNDQAGLRLNFTAVSSPTNLFVTVLIDYAV